MKNIFSISILFSSTTVMAQGSSASGLTIDTNTLLIIFALFLLFPIWILSNTFLTAARKYYTDKLKSRSAKVLLPIGLLLTSSTLFAQGTSGTTPGLSSDAMTILLICVIAAELLLILFFARKTNDFIRKISMGNQPEVIRERQSPYAWFKAKWAEMNFKPIEEEAKIDTGHNYDGIRELDNIIPPWFTTAFVLTILFGIVYLYRYHIAKSAPLQIEEYEIQMAKADLEHDEFLKREANAIDESSIMLMSGADLDAGRKVFVTLCAACHKMDGGGLVGPNLTDDYTLHGGSLQDVFKTIKYGVPEKGMISWKEQLSPMQMAQVSNYILTLRGTNPPDAKEKQGELYVPEAVTTDSLPSNANSVDTVITQ
jgi:cytochrome c oxidase cbb3-type subunit 3